MLSREADRETVLDVGDSFVPITDAALSLSLFPPFAADTNDVSLNPSGSARSARTEPTANLPPDDYHAEIVASKHLLTRIHLL